MNNGTGKAEISEPSYMTVLSEDLTDVKIRLNKILTRLANANSRFGTYPETADDKEPCDNPKGDNIKVNIDDTMSNVRSSLVNIEYQLDSIEKMV